MALVQILPQSPTMTTECGTYYSLFLPLRTAKNPGYYIQNKHKGLRKVERKKIGQEPWDPYVIG